MASIGFEDQSPIGQKRVLEQTSRSVQTLATIGRTSAARLTVRAGPFTDDSHRNDILPVEQIDRLTRLSNSDLDDAEKSR